MSDPDVVQNVSIASDIPQIYPSQDAFGYAPFAKRIAHAVQKTPSPQGLVMAIHGVWGSGKSSLLNFVKFYLAEFPENERPIVIDFNPWWFKDRDDLAAQFLLLFRKRLVGESESIRKIGDLLADYSGSVSKLVAFSYGMPWLDKPVQFLLKCFKRKPKNVPALKAELSTAMQAASQRFVFVVDDIDRLLPNEIQELFKVIKALADFPNTVYLLSFDRAVVADALNKSLGVDGEAYIEKIVQVPFSLPAVDRIRLRQKLFQELDKILESYPLKNFDQTYWGNVYFEGLDHYITKPRDIVRVTNSLAVLYPAVVGEVNPVDFIALEFLRVFEPDVYELIWANKDMFTGLVSTTYRQDINPERAFHNTWLERVPENRRSKIKDLVQRLFPRLETVWSNTIYSDDNRWRKEMRVCTSEYVDVYSQFGVAPESLRRKELEQLINEAEMRPESAAETLKKAATIKRLDGTSKAREYLERLRHLEGELSPIAASQLVRILFDLGDGLLCPEDERGGFTAIPNRWRLEWTINHLLERVPVEDHQKLLLDAATTGHAIGLIADTLRRIEGSLEKPDEPREKPLQRIDEETAKALREIVLRKLNFLDDQQLLAIPDLDYVVYLWGKWQSTETVSIRLQPIINSDQYLPFFLEKYLSFGTRQAVSDVIPKRVSRLNPMRLEPFTDIFSLETRISEMLKRSNLTENQRIAGEQYLRAIERIRAGKDPDTFLSDDD